MSAASAPTPAMVPKNADPRLGSAPRRGGSLTILILAGALSAILFGSRVMHQEVQSEPDALGYETLQRAAVIWDYAMRHVRATLPDTALHDTIRKLEAARF